MNLLFLMFLCDLKNDNSFFSFLHFLNSSNFREINSKYLNKQKESVNGFNLNINREKEKKKNNKTK